MRVRPGVFADAPQWAALEPWNRYLARVHAVALTAPDAVFAFESAVALRGGPIFGDPGVVHVLELTGGTSRLSAGIRSHTGVSDRRLEQSGGLLLTGAADTAVDIARSRHPAVGLAVADHSLRTDIGSAREALLEINAMRASSRGRAHARWPLERATAETESVLESLSCAVFEWLGAPQPDLQVSFRSDTGATDRPDFSWLLPNGRHVAADADGDIKYDGRFGEPIEILHRRADRDDRLRIHLDALAHYGWRQLIDVAPMRLILRELGVPAVAPEHAAPLLTLRRAVSPTRETASTPRNSGRYPRFGGADAVSRR